MKSNDYRLKKVFYLHPAHSIEVRQSHSNPRNFMIKYGSSVKEGLNYTQATKELGESIMHVLKITSIID